MRRITVLAVVLFAPLAALADDADAKKLAQEILTKGAALFDARESVVMADTYTENARVDWIEKDKDTGKYKSSVKEGRAEIERMYNDLFKDAKEKTTSRNTVDYARFVSPDLLVIQGQFEPDTAKDGKYSFVQGRVKQGDRWLIQNLRLYVVSPD